MAIPPLWVRPQEGKLIFSLQPSVGGKGPIPTLPAFLLCNFLEHFLRYFLYFSLLLSQFFAHISSLHGMCNVSFITFSSHSAFIICSHLLCIVIFLHLTPQYCQLPIFAHSMHIFLHKKLTEVGWAILLFLPTLGSWKQRHN